MKRCVSIGLICLLVGLLPGCGDKTPPAYYANQPPQGVEMAKVPRMYVGDYWEFRRTDLTGGDENRDFSMRIIRVNPDGGFKLHYTNLITGSQHIRNYNSNYKYKYYDGEDGEKIKVPWLGRYNFPYWVGKRWNAHFKGESGGGPGFFYVNKFVVLGKEMVTVPAGTFEAFKVRYDQQIASSSRANFINHFWYAPKAKIIVKLESKTQLKVLLKYQVR